MSLSKYHHEKKVDGISDRFVRLLDMYSTTRDILMTIQEHVQELQFSLHRRGQKSCMESKVDAFIRSRKEVKKDIRKCLRELKRTWNKCASSPLISNDQHLVMVNGVLREVKLITIAVLEVILLFMSASRPNLKPSKWSFVSKLVHRGLVACEGEQEDMYEMEYVDVALCALCGRVANKDAQLERVQVANKQLRSIEDVEASLSLLNIFTH